MHARSLAQRRDLTSGATTLYVVTQEPFGQPTQVIAITLTLGDDDAISSGDRAVQPASRAYSRTRLPAPSHPGEGGADIWLQAAGRLFCSDRYDVGVPGALFELSPSNLSILTSAPLGRGPRFTAAASALDDDDDEEDDDVTIYSVSTDDGLLTTLRIRMAPVAGEAEGERLVVEAQQPAFVAQPSFVVRWVESQRGRRDTGRPPAAAAASA